jgi:hypothetical protein
VAEGDGLLNADQHFGHRRFSSQILVSQSLPRSIELAAVGSGRRVLGAGRDNLRDTPTPMVRGHWPFVAQPFLKTLASEVLVYFPVKK